MQDDTEQRLTFRLISYWNRIRADRVFPALADINIHEITEIWHASFIIDVLEDTHIFQYFGTDLIERFGSDFTSMTVEDAMADMLVNNTIGAYYQAIAKRQPVHESASFVDDGVEWRYRTILVPLSDNNQDINFIMGTTRHRLLNI